MKKNESKNRGVDKISLSSSCIEKAYPGKGNKFIVKGNEGIRFYVSGWLPDTSPEEKNTVFWRYEWGDSLYKEGIGKDSAEITIENSRCGSVPYILSARLPGQKETQAKEIQILGICDYKVTSCQWYLKDQKDGKQKTIIEDGQEIPFGPVVFLELHTEGLNGNRLIVDIYARGGSVLIDSLKSNKTVDGIVTLSINTITLKNKLFRACKSWRSQEGITIKVAKDDRSYDRSEDKEKDGIYVKQEHGRGPLLFMQDVRPFIYDAEVNSSLSKTTIGRSEPVNIEYDQCTFEKVTIKNEDKEFTVFEGGKLYKPVFSSNQYYTKAPFILFDFDSYALDRAASERLDYIAEYLISSDMPAALEGHTDIRGTVEYNKTLAYNRVKAVEQYLIDKGVSTKKLSIVAFNESNPVHGGENIPDSLHRENRRVRVCFNVLQTYNDARTYSIISTTEEYPKRFDIKIEGYTNKNCFYDDEYAHTPVFTIKRLHTSGDEERKEEIPVRENEENIIPFAFSAKAYDMRDSEFRQVMEWGAYYEQLEHALNDRVKAYECHLHSCAYFSDKTKPAFILKVYPDAVVTCNFRVDFEDEYYFDELKIGLIKGNNGWNEFKESVDYYFEGLTHFLFESPFIPGFISNTQHDMLELVKDWVYSYVDSKINLFRYGVHSFQDFLQKNVPARVSDETGEHRKDVEGRIMSYVGCMMIVDLLLLVFTKGKGVAAKYKSEAAKFEVAAAKSEAVEKVQKFLSDNGLKITTPKIAESSWVGYQQQDEGYVSYVYRYKIKADPMFGVNISIKSVSLASKAGKAIYSPGEDEDYGELKKGILKSALKKILPVDASFSFSADGGFSFDYEVRYDYTRKKLKVIDRYTLQEYQDKTLFNMGGFISIKMDVKLKAKYRIKWHPFVSSAKISAKIEANAEISGGFMLQVRFTTHVLNPYYEWVLVFTGLKGEYYQKVTVKANNDDIYDSEPDQNEILVDTNPAQADNTPPVKEHFSILDKKEIVIKRVNL